MPPSCVYAPVTIVSFSSPTSIACFVSIGSMSTAALSRAAAFRPRLIGSSADCRPVRLAYQPDSSQLKGTLHAPRAAHRLLGARPDRRGAVAPGPRSRIAGLRLGVVGGGVRLGCGDGTGVASGSDGEDQARLGDLPDAGPLPRDDRDDRGHARPVVERADADRDRIVGSAGRRRLAWAAVCEAAAAHA